MSTITFRKKLLYSCHHLILIQLSNSIPFPLKQFIYSKTEFEKTKLVSQ